MAVVGGSDWLGCIPGHANRPRQSFAWPSCSVLGVVPTPRLAPCVRCSSLLPFLPAQLILPQKQVDRRSDIYVFCCSYSHNVAPKNKWLAFVSTTVETADPHAELAAGAMGSWALEMGTARLGKKGEGEDGLVSGMGP